MFSMFYLTQYKLCGPFVPQSIEFVMLMLIREKIQRDLFCEEVKTIDRSS